MFIPTKEYLFGSLFLLANRLQAVGDTILEEITLKQWILLVMIFNMDKNKPSVSEIAEFIGSTRQNVRKMLDTLATNGYVTLSVSDQDRRSLAVSLTDKTLFFFRDFESWGSEFLKELFAGIEPDLLEATRYTFETLFNNLEGMKKKYEKINSHL